MQAATAARQPRIFVLEDQAEIGRLVCRTLEDHGFRTEHFGRARTFLSRIKVRRPDLAIVDLGLPDEDGLSVIREVLANNPVPVIILTGRGETIDRVLGLELGADDYVVKPFDPRELVARVKVVLRRIERGAAVASEAGIGTAAFKGWRFDADTNTLTDPGGAAAELSAAEAQLLLALCRAPNRILSRDALMSDRGHGDRAPFDRSIDVRISRLRQKLEADPKHPQIIKTVYGAGYIFAAAVTWSPHEE
jgi:DNA-binding response OmpR family regulator